MIRIENPYEVEIVRIYNREFRWILLLDALMIGIIIIGYAVSIGIDPNAGYYKLYLPVCLLSYTLMSIILFHRVTIFLHYDHVREDIAYATGQVESISQEQGWVFRFGESFVAKFYPKVEDVRRYRIYYMDADEKRRFVRTVMSHTKCFLMYQMLLDIDNKPTVKLKFYTRSKVLIALNFQDEELQEVKAINNLKKFSRYL